MRINSITSPFFPLASQNYPLNPLGIEGPQSAPENCNSIEYLRLESLLELKADFGVTPLIYASNISA